MQRLRLRRWLHHRCCILLIAFMAMATSAAQGTDGAEEKGYEIAGP